MNKYKVFGFVLVFALSLFICTANIKADCTQWSASECESHGCALSDDGHTCIYPNYSENTTWCGSGDVNFRNIPKSIPKITRAIFMIIQIAVPVLLVIFGMLDLMKGITSQKEDEIKKGQQLLIKRIITALLVFFVFVLVKFFIGIVADNGVGLMDCADCFIRNNCGG